MEETLTLQGRSVRVSNPRKIFYPATGFTKGDMIDYYLRIAPALLPHLRARPISLKRYPDGVNGISFYEKQCPSHRPEWVHVAPIWSETRSSNIQYCVIDDLPSLIWAANIAVLEIHASLATTKNLLHPTAMVFDLDPGEGAGMVECCQLGLRVHNYLEKDGLRCCAKTSGSKGLQVYVPLIGTGYESTKSYSRAMAQFLERETPDQVVSRMSKALRQRKVFVDWSQNDEHKTTVCVYSLRAKDVPSVSTPVTWDEVAQASRSRAKQPLAFGPKEVLARVKKQGDLFAPLLKIKQRLPERSQAAAGREK